MENINFMIPGLQRDSGLQGIIVAETLKQHSTTQPTVETVTPEVSEPSKL